MNDEFYLPLVLAIIESNRLETTRRKTETDMLLEAVVSDLKERFPLPQDVTVEDDQPHSLERKIQALITSWLTNKRMSAGSYIDGGFFGFDNPEERALWLPKINGALAIVGLIAFPDEQPTCVFVQPIGLKEK